MAADNERMRKVREWIEQGMREHGMVQVQDPDFASDWTGVLGEVRNMLLAIESGVPPWHGDPPKFVPPADTQGGRDGE